MPYEYRVAETEGLIRVTAWGEADVAEILAMLRQMEVDARVKAEMPAVIDARSQQCRLAPPQLRQLAELHAASSGGARRPVAVVCSPGLGYGLGRMLSVFSGKHGAELQVFSGVAEAEGWARARVKRDSHGQEA